MRKILLGAAVLWLGGCGAVAQNKVETALTDAGLSKPVAGCMADRMVDKLSIEQLRSIGRLKEKSGNRGEGVGLAEFLLQHRGELDPEVYSVIARAGVGCALRG